MIDRETIPPGWTKADEEIETGVGIRWVSDQGIHGRPTEHDVKEYLKRRGDSIKCGCESCAQPAIPPGWRLVPETPTREMMDVHDSLLMQGVVRGRDVIYHAMLQAAPEMPK